MKIIISGAGQVGGGIAERLAAEGHEVTIIDLRADLVRTISDELDVRGVVGHGAHPDVLEEAGIGDADMIIAVTHADEVNMVACEVANALFNVPVKIARVRDQSYLKGRYRGLFSRDNTAIDIVISPEIAVAEMVLGRLALPGATETVRMASDRVMVLGLKLDENCPILDTPLAQLAELFPDLRATVVGISRDGMIVVPDSETVMEAGDEVYVVTDAEQAARVLGLFGLPQEPARNIVIGGGGNIGLCVARRLEEQKRDSNVRLIESARRRAEEIAERLPHTIVLHGSALNAEILKEADIAHADMYVALTNDDKVNLLSSLLARQEGAAHVMSLISSLETAPLARPLGLQSWLDPRAVTVSEILQFVRRGRIRRIYPVQGSAAEVIEAEALDTSPIINKPLREADLPGGVRIGAVVRGDEVITPGGETQVRAGDTVILFALHDRADEVQRLFRVSLEYF
ncbi:MAG TPA: Trk system potassium transporter TrkA [Thermopetrobacter sp.]|nr:Trk system potassium transporter TrkA [Thermopetrobacter sp.]